MNLIPTIACGVDQSRMFHAMAVKLGDETARHASLLHRRSRKPVLADSHRGIDVPDEGVRG